MNKYEDAKDELVGKALEAAGKVTKDQELEFSGKFWQMTTEIKGATREVKENVLGKANNMIDKVRDNKDGKT